MSDLGLIAAAIVVLALAAAPIGPGARGQTAESSWLDARPIANWNEPGAAIPRGPRAETADLEECERRGAPDRLPATSESRQVAAAGWHGARVDKRAGDAVFVFARNGVDGMCRPMAYQIFVFVGGRFAGTVAPRPMNSREDGSGTLAENVNARRFMAEFARYRGEDPLCCPSRITAVTYEIRPAPGGQGMLVVPTQVRTRATQ